MASKAAEIRPPAEDSAIATVSLRAVSSWPMCSARAIESSMPVTGGSVSQQAEAALFDDRPAHVAGVDSHVAPAADACFLHARGEERRVKASIAQRWQGGAAPQTGEWASFGKADPATPRREVASIDHVDRQVVGRVLQFIGEPL